MNMKKEQTKKLTFLILYILFTVLVFVGAFMVITKKVNSAGYAVVPMILAIIFGILYRNSKKAIEENKQ